MLGINTRKMKRKRKSSMNLSESKANIAEVGELEQ
jgi:hypothetical protein